MNLLVISCSLNPASRSALLAEAALGALGRLGHEAHFIDLAKRDLPPCDGGACFERPEVIEIGAEVARADGILLACPIYNYDVSAAAKNLVELTGKAWTEKVVGFLLAAGGSGSYMAVMPFANSLMLDFRSVIVPRFVYASREAFDPEGRINPGIEDRVAGLAETWVRMTAALRPPPRP